MKFSVDDTVTMLGADMTPEPWDLELGMDGQDFKVRPLTPADVQRLRRLEAIGVPEAEQREVIRSMFEDPKPKDEQLSAERMTAVFVRMVGYQQGRLQKNLQAVVAQTAAAAMRRA